MRESCPLRAKGREITQPRRIAACVDDTLLTLHGHTAEMRDDSSPRESALMVSHALGINLKGNGNEILLTRGRERERKASSPTRNPLGKSAFSGEKLGSAEALLE